MKENPRDIASVEMRIDLMDFRPAAESYDPSPAVALEWRGRKPPNMDLAVGERLATLSASEFSDQAYARLALEVVNSGRISITALRFEIELLDAAGALIDSRPIYAVTTSKSALKPGGRIVVGGTYGMPKSRAPKTLSYRLAVISIEG